MRDSQRTAKVTAGRLVAPALWYAGMILLLLTIARGWAAHPFPQPFKPQLPYQYTPFSDPRFWVFLAAASDCVPTGAKFTVTGPSRDDEHELYVLSVGAVPQGTPLSASYFGYKQNEHIARATHILSFGGEPPFGEVRATCAPPFGVVYERIPARPR